MKASRHRSARFATALVAAGGLALFGAASAAAGPDPAPEGFVCHYDGHHTGLTKALQDVECLLQELHYIFTHH